MLTNLKHVGGKFKKVRECKNMFTYSRKNVHVSKKSFTTVILFTSSKKFANKKYVQAFEKNADIWQHAHVLLTSFDKTELLRLIASLKIFAWYIAKAACSRHVQTLEKNVHVFAKAARA